MCLFVNKNDVFVGPFIYIYISWLVNLPLPNVPLSGNEGNIFAIFEVSPSPHLKSCNFLLVPELHVP